MQLEHNEAQETLKYWQQHKPHMVADIGKAVYVYEKMLIYGISFGDAEIAMRSAIDSGHLANLCEQYGITTEEYFVFNRFVIAYLHKMGIPTSGDM